jgi:hypothetical protein
MVGPEKGKGVDLFQCMGYILRNRYIFFPFHIPGTQHIPLFNYFSSDTALKPYKEVGMEMEQSHNV